MINIQRTPPSTPNNLTSSSSDPNISVSNTNENKQQNSKMNPRNKRPRSECSPISDLSTLKHELKLEIEELLEGWTITQNNNMEKLMGQQYALLNKLVSEVSDLKSQNTDLKKSFEEVEKSMCFINSKYEDLTQKVDSLEKERTQLIQKVQNLENRLCDQEHNMRNASVEIRNIPSKDKETPEDLINIISKIGSTTGVQVLKSEMRDIRRLPGKPGTIKTIIAEFSQVQNMHNFVNASKTYNKKHTNTDKLNTVHLGIPGERRPIYISEYLPLQSKKLLFSSRTFAKENNYTFCWTANGNIFLRKSQGDKQVLVRSEQTLKDLLTKN